jgi:hypothetical protein
LTVTRPAMIMSSAGRSAATPARANTLCNRSSIFKVIFS